MDAKAYRALDPRSRVRGLRWGLLVARPGDVKSQSYLYLFVTKKKTSSESLIGHHDVLSYNASILSSMFIRSRVLA